MDNHVVQRIVKQVLQQIKEEEKGAGSWSKITVGVSNRHIHLSEKDAFTLFGTQYQLGIHKQLSQPGEFAACETVTLVAPKGVLRNVRILGPIRKSTQVEISKTDGYTLGIHAPVCNSGDIEGSVGGVTVVGPQGAVTLREGVICAARHLHMSSDDARRFALHDGDKIAVETTGMRAIIFKNVLVRAGNKYRLELHLDTDEANAAGLVSGAQVYIKRLL